MRRQIWFIVGLIALVILAAVAWQVVRAQDHKNPVRPSTTPPLMAAGRPVPADSVKRAQSKGYYCPSWDAKPGQVVPEICYPLSR